MGRRTSIMNSIYMLLFLLAGCMLLGVIRVIRGGSFLPEANPGEERHLRDREGRWWREDADGALQEAFPRREYSRKATFKFWSLVFLALASFIAIVWTV